MQRSHLNGERFCGDYSTRKVHDLDNQHKKCLVDEFINSGNDIPFESLEIALQAGYVKCHHCLDGDL